MMDAYDFALSPMATPAAPITLSLIKVLLFVMVDNELLVLPEIRGQKLS
jgi:hypothetical protein